MGPTDDPIPSEDILAPIDTGPTDDPVLLEDTLAPMIRDLQMTQYI
jgi:hypothetical protein